MTELSELVSLAHRIVNALSSQPEFTIDPAAKAQLQAQLSAAKRDCNAYLQAMSAVDKAQWQFRRRLGELIVSLSLLLAGGG